MLGQNQDRESSLALLWLQPNASTKSWEGRASRFPCQCAIRNHPSMDSICLEYNIHILRQMVIQPDLLVGLQWRQSLK